VNPPSEPLPVDPSLPCEPLGCDPLGCEPLPWETLVLVSPSEAPLPPEPLADSEPLADWESLPLELGPEPPLPSEPLADLDWLPESELLADDEALALNDPLPESDESDELLLDALDDELLASPHVHSLKSKTSQKSPGSWA